MKICQGIAQTINRAMIVRSKTLSALAEEIGVPISSLQNYASGHSNPRADTIEILAEKLGVSPAELIFATMLLSTINQSSSSASSTTSSSPI